MVETEFSLVRFAGDKNKAESVYKGFKPLSALDIAETVLFSTSRDPNVQIASILVLPTHQASVSNIYRQ